MCVFCETVISVSVKIGLERCASSSHSKRFAAENKTNLYVQIA